MNIWVWCKRIAIGAMLLTGIFAAISSAIPLVLRATMNPYIYFSAAALPHAQAALVLGASVADNKFLSPILMARADGAIALYKSHIVSKILVSGDNATVSYNEVSPVRRYLLAQGVAPEDIFLDHAGFDTYSSMYRARHVFGVISLIIVSQSFHLPRALFLARSFGIASYGLVVPGGGFINALREIPAADKAVYDVFIHRIPEFPGPSIPITGNGEVTWP